MVLGIFVGTGMDVRAEGSVSYNYDSINVDDILHTGDIIEFSITGDQRGIVGYYDADGTTSLLHSHDNVYFFLIAPSATGHTVGGYTGNGTSTGISGDLTKYSNWIVIKKDISSGNYLRLYLRGYVETDGAGTVLSSTPHTHSYSWVTVQEANAGQDGIEEYRCSCGDVQGRNVIPTSEVAVKGLFGEIKNAPQNGTATFDSGRLYTISDYVIKKLAERTDVTTVITFEYQNQSYKMTIPAGADFTSLLADEDYFYGYFFFANAVGATIEAL